MKIKITPHQLGLLHKRNAAATEATAGSKTAQLLMKQAMDHEQQMREVLVDVISCISSDAGNKPTEFVSFNVGTDDNGEHFLDLIEPLNPANAV